MITRKNKPSRPIAFLAAATLISLGTLFACSTSPNDNDDGGTQSSSSVAGGDQSSSSIAGQSSSSVAADGINWSNEAGGTIEVSNLTDKAIVLYQGDLPVGSNILGGVNALSSKFIDISDDVPDYGVGGYIVLRGVSKDEYEKNKANLKNAKVEYSAMVVYGQNKKFKIDIRPDYIGDYGFTVTNKAKVGIELRKNSPNGEKIAFIPKLSVNNLVYSDETKEIGLYPVYTWYNKSTKSISTAEVDDITEATFVAPRPLTGNPPNRIFGDKPINFKSPVAYITVTNNISNVSTKFTIAGLPQISQNNYDAVESGEQLTFEIASSDAGTAKNLVMSFKGGVIEVPVRFAGETEQPKLKNGYDYTVTVIGTEANPSEAVIEELGQRDMAKEIESL